MMNLNTQGYEMNPRIIGIAGPFQGTVLSLDEGEATIGRDSSNQMWIADALLSRRHFSVSRQGMECTIRDLGSHNGTQVNGMSVREQALAHGDQITAGNSLLVFLAEEHAPAQRRHAAVFEDTTDAQTVTVRWRGVEDLPHAPEKLIFGLSETPRLTRDLNALLKIATAIGGIRDSDSLQWQLLGFLFDIVPADRGAVMYFDKAGEIAATAAWDRAQGPEHAVPVNRAVTQQVFREREGVIVNNPGGSSRNAEAGDAGGEEVRSLLCAPMLHSGAALGAIYLDTREEKGRFDENHLRVVTAVGSIAALALDNLRHWEELEEENRELRAEINLDHNMIGESPRVKEVFKFVRRVAPTDSTVLIGGESGTGKELVARAIHRNSARSERPFVAINCAAITDTLLESELFGHEKGAFTGAGTQKKGKMEIADGGTLFLDEIGELAPGLQAKLLRVLQEREFERVGGTTPVPLNIRLIAATNRNLQEAIEAGEFRKDLYYRLNVVTVWMPALRERKEDIALLAEHFLAKARKKCKTPIKEISEEAKACLVNYDWPGNVRELENAIERAVVLGTGEAMLPDDLPETVLECGAQAGDSTANYHGAIKDSKRQLVLQALQQTKGNYIEAAKILGIHPNSLLRLIRNLGIKPAAKAAAPPTRGN